jgi:DNA-directed RNA polymerase specialized sigma24 family protein
MAHRLLSPVLFTRNDIPQNRGSATDPDFENLVTLHYEALCRFAFTLTRSEAEASDLTQQTFLTWATKGGPLRDASKAKTWLLLTSWVQGKT